MKTAVDCLKTLAQYSALKATKVTTGAPVWRCGSVTDAAEAFDIEIGSEAAAASTI